MAAPLPLVVFRTTLPNDTPIAGCELVPYVLLRRADASCTTEDITQDAPENGAWIKSRWYKGSGQAGRCFVHPDAAATMQCVGSRRFYCGSTCFCQGWRDWMKAKQLGRENGRDDGDLNRGHGYSTGHLNGGGWVEVRPKSGLNVQRRSPTGGFQVCRTRAFTPGNEDVGHTLKFECQPMDAHTGQPLAPATVLLIPQRVIAQPQPITRRMIPIVPDAERVGRFTVLSYNVLADLYASAELYNYCPSWALAWSYRRQNLVRELLSYNADILCLQEVQDDHFQDYFAPTLQKHGYTAVYKKKTAQVFTGQGNGNGYTIDGCATFFKKDRFTMIKKYEVEFNKAAFSLSEALGASGLKKEQSLARLMKDNVALIVVLEALEGTAPPAAAGMKRQLLCVANTHIHANPELNDVKLWQVHTLLKGLEKIDASAEIPMVVCGDFNSVPGSAAHSLLATGRVDPSHPELGTDPLGILRPPTKLGHKLPLSSAYAAALRPEALSSDVQGVERLRTRLEAGGEPGFTNITREFVGTLDYVFFTANSLAPAALLELPSEQEIRGDKGVALPSATMSSDHVALMASFQWVQRRS